MAYYNAELQQSIIEKIVAEIKKSLPADQAFMLTAFARYYLSKVSDQDLSERTIDNLYGSVLAAWNFLTSRKNPQECSVRVYNPDFEQAGWESNHTIIEVAMPNRPFVLDSLRNELARHGHVIYVMICPGGVVLERDKEGKVISFRPIQPSDRNSDVIVELSLYVEINRQPDQKYLTELKHHIEYTLQDVETAVQDWSAMQTRAQDILKGLKNPNISLSGQDVQEAALFIEWIIENNFTFLGMADYHPTKKHQLERTQGTSLGLAKTKQYAILDPHVAAKSRAINPYDGNQVLWLQQVNEISTVHRPSRPYCIAIKHFDEKGVELGERRIYGLFTSVAYHSNPLSIPLLRVKVENIIARAGFSPESHSGRTLFNVLETYPRDELIQGREDDVFDISMGIMQLQERRRLRLFIRKDVYDRYFSCLIYVPRERFNSSLRQKMSDILMNALGGEHVDFMTHFSESILARIHLMIYMPVGANVPDYDNKALEDILVEAERTWSDDLYGALVEHFGEGNGVTLYEHYKNAFPAGYQESYSARTAAHDVEHMETLSDENPIGMNLFRPLDQFNGFVNFKLYLRSEAIPLSDALPLLENMGFKVIGERSSQITLEHKTYFVSEFSLTTGEHTHVNVESVKANFQEAFARTWRGDAESDAFNNLIIAAELNWRETALMRTYAKYFRQIGFHFSLNYLAETLVLYPEIVKRFVRLFHLYFDPSIKRDEAAVAAIQTDILAEIDAVTNLDQDRILRCFLVSINASVRTNFYQKDDNGEFKSYISIKIKSAEIPDVPLPHPAFEIFVYAPWVEGVHLRGGKVARGGLRWSDRREDFRTEILGLMKAQTVKNAVIVPTGAKGGFVPKKLSTDSREEYMNEGIRCYKTFISALLDITDNRSGDKVIPPRDVVRRDEDDPYLVVAADKGTASFSDIANSVAAEYHFWLGDAFASGGSCGYDHKKMGITAKGGWESVKRHFRGLNIDIQHDDFTVIGIGDMAGDVFGNGMLLSDHIKLLAAFNHMHIFLDPTPDPIASFAERQRLFNLPRSAWSDYNPELISKGGGVFNRSDKSIKITPEVKTALNIQADFMAPNDLISAILQAPVDLLWNGGIGTYVKASTEQNNEVGDRANDALRINGNQLRARVVGEGGNLGMTQLGRVEYSLNGGICYTDFIDNSAGVDCSDHEVNIKILLDQIMSQGDMTEKQRNELLVSMTEEVGTLVLEDNYQQTQAISLAAWRASATFDEYVRFLTELERSDLINRDLEFLPNDKELARRRAASAGLFTRPELCILLAYSKITFKESLMQSDLLEDPATLVYLAQAFPQALGKKYMPQMEAHRLRREITATQLSNTIVNRMGATYIKRIYDETGSAPDDVARSFIVSSNVFDVNYFWTNIQALDNQVSSDVQSQMMVLLVRLIRRASRWFLRNRRGKMNIQETIDMFKPNVATLFDNIADLLAGEELEKLFENTKILEDAGVSHQLALRVASCRSMISALDIIESSIASKIPLQSVSKVYFALGARLELDWFRARIAAHDVNNNWDALARAACRDDIDRQQRSLTDSVMEYCEAAENTEDALNHWESDMQAMVNRWRQMIADLRASTSEDFTMYAVALRELLDLAQASESHLDMRKQA
jgi:glutamate dehydrogenase